MSDGRPRSTARYVAAGILVSRTFGFVRNRAFARFLGDTAAADAFNAALKIPNVIRNLLGEGAISASFIPVYSALLGRGEHESARRVAGAVLGILLGALSLLTIVGIASAPTLARILAPGFDAERYALTVRLLRVLFPMTGLMVVSGWCLGVRNSHKLFLGSYASAALWSLAQIALLLGLGPRTVSLTDLAWWLAWATLAGSVSQVAAQLPQVLRLVRPLSIVVDPHNGDVREILANFIPVVVSLGPFQISSFIDLQIASWLPSGSVSQLSYATTLYLLPIGLFSVPVSASALPEFARDTASISLDALRERLRDGWMRILFYIVPTSLLFVVYGNSIVALLYCSGRFGVEQERAVHLTIRGRWPRARCCVGLLRQHVRARTWIAKTYRPSVHSGDTHRHLADCAGHSLLGGPRRSGARSPAAAALRAHGNWNGGHFRRCLSVCFLRDGERGGGPVAARTPTGQWWVTAANEHDSYSADHGMNACIKLLGVACVWGHMVASTLGARYRIRHTPALLASGRRLDCSMRAEIHRSRSPRRRSSLVHTGTRTWSAAGPQSARTAASM